MPFDTIKYAFPTVLLRISEGKFIKDKDKKGKEFYLPRTCEKFTGLNSLRVGDTETAIEMSAKILKGNYPKLLSADTIEEALTNLLNSNLICFDVHEVLNFAHVLKAHQAKDFQLSELLTNYVTPLEILHTNKNYRLTNYSGETLTYCQEVITAKNREYFKIYDKGLEYELRKNADYRETLTQHQKHSISSHFKGATRIETELNSKRKLRQYYPDIPRQIWLNDLLLSDADPIKAQFEEITKNIYEYMEEKEKSTEFIKTLEYNDQLLFNMLEKYEYDLQRVKAWLKNQETISKSKLYRQQREYERILQLYKNYQVDGKAKSLLIELKEKITAPTSTAYHCETPLSDLTLGITAAANESAGSLYPYHYRTSLSKMTPEAAEPIVAAELEEQLKKMGYSKKKQKADDEFWESIAASNEPYDDDCLPW